MPWPTFARSTPAFLSARIQSISSRRRRLLAQLRRRAQPEEHLERVVEHAIGEVGMVDAHDLRHQLAIGELDVVEHAAAQERVGQLLLVVRRDDDDRPLLRDDLVAGLVDAEAHRVELVQQVVRELDVGLVDLVDQQHDARRRRERLAERAELDVLRDVADVAAEARVVEALHGVVDVEAVLAPSSST